MKILVTSVAGFRYHLWKRLAQRSHDVVELYDINDYYYVYLKWNRLNLLPVAEGYKYGIFESSKINRFRFIRLDLEDRQQFRKVFNENITLLKYAFEYPAIGDQANLLTIPDFKEALGIKVEILGYTTDSTGRNISFTLGATVIEKYFTSDTSLGGPYSTFSILALESQPLVKAVLQAENRWENNI